jgi:peroxiredoxin
MSLVAALLLSGLLLLLHTPPVRALHVGVMAPAFSLPATVGGQVSLAAYRGKQPVVLFFYIAAFGGTWTQDALAFQLALPQFEAANAQVLGVSVDWPGANQAWARDMGVTYPLLSDLSRAVPKAYGVLYDDPTLLANPKQLPLYLRAKGAWFVIDTTGVIRATKTLQPGELIVTEEIVQALTHVQ